MIDIDALAQPEDPEGDHLSVLIVEDDLPTLRLVERMIRARGHLVRGCESAEVALSMMKDQWFHLLMLDVQLPGMSGLDLARAVRAHDLGKHYYILVGTGQDRPDDLAIILAAGADDYIAKPYHSGLLAIRFAVAEAAVKNIVERRHLAHELEFLADHDPLTKLLNRRRLSEYVTQAIDEARQGQGGAVFYIDLDNFKVVNDTLGHDQGDQLLLAVADILRGSLRKDDALFRFGGDEFIMLLATCSRDEATAIAQGLITKISNLVFDGGGRSFSVGASIGVVPLHGTKNSTELLAAADAACYAAKAEGKNCAVWYEKEGALESLVADTDWTSRLRQAMQQGLLHLYFQPIMDVSSGTIAAQELLLRLDDEPSEVGVLPSAYMKSIQRSGQAAKLDRFVVSHAVEMLAGGGEDCFSINITGSSLCDPTFGPFLISTFEARNVNPARLILELSADEAIACFSNAQQSLALLREKGFRFAMEYFANGILSLNSFCNLPVDMIKIDARLIEYPKLANAEVHSPSNQSLAVTCGIPVVAQHVETQAQFQAVAQMGIPFVQGFYVGKPRATPYRQSELLQAVSGLVIPPEDV